MKKDNSVPAVAAPIPSKLQALLQLRERLSKATGPDRAIDKAILAAFGYTWRGMDHWHSDNKRMWSGPTFFSSSIDAAVTLVPPHQPWRCGIDLGGITAFATISPRHPMWFAATVPLAICLARIEYEISKEQANG